jgi:hypothetical protein
MGPCIGKDGAYTISALRVPKREAIIPHVGSLAQLAEQWTFNPLVEGSNPS